MCVGGRGRGLRTAPSWELLKGFWWVDITMIHEMWLFFLTIVDDERLIVVSRSWASAAWICLNLFSLFQSALPPSFFLSALLSPGKERKRTEQPTHLSMPLFFPGNKKAKGIMGFSAKLVFTIDASLWTLFSLVGAVPSLVFLFFLLLFELNSLYYYWCVNKQNGVLGLSLMCSLILLPPIPSPLTVS